MLLLGTTVAKQRIASGALKKVLQSPATGTDAPTATISNVPGMMVLRSWRIRYWKLTNLETDKIWSQRDVWGWIWEKHSERYGNRQLLKQTGGRYKYRQRQIVRQMPRQIL